MKRREKILPLEKKNRSNRVCIDYRWLNKLTVFDFHPMIQPADVFQNMEKDRCFSNINLSKGCREIPALKIHPENGVCDDESAL
ncbi:transposon ty3-g Gag-Pol polyprotein [Plakobranchus ocellatus]|uniref:Transposon ty3-g Gag-Pol polyprotein n=1 Tax=Plakobranchus ocellatus TaxID=259542 RepID=A0AAV4A637_9GAST|nr:transposon ty3-g Gag-Pol polyprotein [Plakobranchus ocellatus]